MIALLAALPLLQAQATPSATVGDTVWLATRVPVASRQILRPQTWDLGEIAQVLGPPDVSYDGDSALVRYPVVFWYPGEHKVSLPGPIVVSPEGRSDTLPARNLMVNIWSVLPRGARREALAPKPAAGLVNQDETSWLPVGVAALLVTLASAAVGLWLAARRRPVIVPEPPLPPPPDRIARLDQWAAAGETRAALDGWAHLIEERLAAAPGEEARKTVEPLLVALGTIGFRPDTPPADVDRLISAARRWLGEAR